MPERSPAVLSRRQRGVSLVEALVAMTVMAFGMLGVVGMQGTLRGNSDIAKQRAEAVRVAQAALEDWRSFDTLGGFNGVVVTGTLPVTTYTGGYTTNTSYTRTAAVVPDAVGADAPKLKSVNVRVAWANRAGEAVAINLVSSIAGIAPELAGSLGLPGDRGPSSTPRGRHPAIPPGAVDQVGTGTSLFTLPGGGGLSWVFNNVTGLIIRVCNPAPTCTDTSLAPLSGFVRFSTGAPPNSENPTSPAFAVGVAVEMTVPAVTTEACFTEALSGYVAYYCALPRTTTLPATWSGRSVLTGLSLAATLADAGTSLYKVCRYTPELNDAPAGGNPSHPLDYADVRAPLANQNFLVISAGDGSTAYACPVDTSGTPVDGDTFRHQPLT